MRLSGSLKNELIAENLGSKQLYFSFGGSHEEGPQPPPVTVLPEFDSLMMGYEDKSRFLSDDKIKRVFLPLGIISPTILVNGFVGAIWKRRRDDLKGKVVSVTPLRELTTGEKSQIEEAFAEYSRYLEVEVALELKN